MILPDHLSKLGRPQLVGERPRRIAIEACGREQARPTAIDVARPLSPPGKKQQLGAGPIELHL